MLRQFALSTVLFFVLCGMAWAEELVIDVSQDRVSLTTWFTGSNITVFGAIRGREPIAEPTLDDVLITVRGPTETVTIWQKTHRFGIWMNTAEAEIPTVPSFFAVSATGAIDDILGAVGPRATDLDIFRQIVANTDELPGSAAFAEAYIRLRQADGLYSESDASIRLLDETLFRTDFSLPSVIKEGNYDVRAFLLRDGRIIAETQTLVHVRRARFESWLYKFAHERRIVYGALSIIIAISAGWLASAVFRLLSSITE